MFDLFYNKRGMKEGGREGLKGDRGRKKEKERRRDNECVFREILWFLFGLVFSCIVVVYI